MLTQIYINNFVTIHELTLDFMKGTTVLTGETGAGKSILIDAVELALGGRASEHVVRNGQEKADISLCFDIGKLSAVREWLKNYDLLAETNECIIRRTLNKDGRSRSFVNSMPVTLNLVRELSELFIAIHGQHEHQALFKMDKQREMLDEFAGHHFLVNKVKALALDWKSLNDELAELRKLSNDRSARSDFLKFQINEIAELQIIPDEFTKLDLEHKQLAHAEELLQNLNLSLECLTANEENNALRLLNQVLQALETVQRVDPKISVWVENIKSAIIQISDTEDELQRYLDVTDLDPERLAWVEERISVLFNVARKYKISPNELSEFQQTLTDELNQLENSDERLTELTKKINLIEQEYAENAAKLTKSRKQSAKKLSAEITTLIRELSLPHAEFNIEFENLHPTSFSAQGLEKIIFLIKTNAGQTMQALAKIASGGELSRIGLAIHIATAEQHTIPTLIFDEVDVGISGGTAEIVGKMLRKLGKTHQVLCITHLPQVASQGHQHLCVKKMIKDNMTYTHLEMLEGKEKTQEIARLLGGVKLTQTTLAHAKEMLEKVN